ncbi:tautomerase family protein [Nocardia altamirensis]|uniref:tautomerase family protein n=1 Tax=Nocardia altamirensis TaxID=472158 RepID=UPI00083FF5F4|nr:tautomerase family protein [Nocardia altamirensis]
MPLVRISLNRRAGDFARRVGDSVHSAMVETLGIPEGDRFQIITQRDPGEIVYDSTFLDIERTDGIVIIQISLVAGRDRDVKSALYASIAERLSADLGIRREDVFISLMEAAPADFSFGNGEAQFAYHLPPHLQSS